MTAEAIPDAELERLALHAGVEGGDFMPHPPTGRHPMCEWCQSAHIQAARLIAEIRRLQDENERCKVAVKACIDWSAAISKVDTDFLNVAVQPEEVKRLRNELGRCAACGEPIHGVSLTSHMDGLDRHPACTQ